MDGVLFRCRVRGTTREGYRIRLSLNWAFARRADLILTDTALVCGDWIIPYAEIEKAYGMRGQGPIGPNEALVFDIKLIDVK